MYRKWYLASQFLLTPIYATLQVIAAVQTSIRLIPIHLSWHFGTHLLKRIVGRYYTDFISLLRMRNLSPPWLPICSPTLFKVLPLTLTNSGRSLGSANWQQIIVMFPISDSRTLNLTDSGSQRRQKEIFSKTSSFQKQVFSCSLPEDNTYEHVFYKGRRTVLNICLRSVIAIQEEKIWTWKSVSDYTLPASSNVCFRAL